MSGDSDYPRPLVPLEPAPKISPESAPDDGTVTDRVLTAGEYLFGLRYLQTKKRPEVRSAPRRGSAASSLGGDHYYRCRYEVLDGPLGGRGFWAAMGTDIRRKGARVRWQAWARAVGHAGDFDPSDEAEVERIFLFRGFRAIVSVEQKRTSSERVMHYTATEIDRYIYANALSTADHRAIDRWRSFLRSEGILR